MITMETDKGEIVSSEVFVNAGYGYHIHAELVGRLGTVAMAQPSLTLSNREGRHGHAYPDNWIPRFREGYRAQMNEWVHAVKSGSAVGASAWDGYVASAIAEQVAEALSEHRATRLDYGARPALYD